jgi:hypothetical protein
MYVVFDEELLQPSALSGDALNFGCRNAILRHASCISLSVSATILSAVALLKCNELSVGIPAQNLADILARARDESPRHDIAQQNLYGTPGT